MLGGSFSRPTGAIGRCLMHGDGQIHKFYGQVFFTRKLNSSSREQLNLLPPHSLLPTRMLWRSFLISTISSNRFLFGPALSILKFFAKPRGGLLDVNKNPVLRMIFKQTLYNHFCAGENPREVKKTIRNIKDMGFRGVILTYAAEVVVDRSTEEEVGTGAQQLKEKGISANEKESAHDPAIEMWRKGVLDTAGMLGEGDYLALKLTGAGPAVADTLKASKPLPSQMLESLEDVCEEAIKRQACILMDAEQHFVQPGIDQIAMDLMRKYNRGERATVYNTYQAYLKITPDVLSRHLAQAQQENFPIGIKLVRGAYINSEPRRLINDTKEATDNSYDNMARGLLQCEYPTSNHNGTKFPKARLFLATHNKASVLKASDIQRERAEAGLPLIRVRYGQLLGMADEVSCTMLQLKKQEEHAGAAPPPEVYKCLSWGTLGECISYLLRRAVENRDAVGRTEQERVALKKEIIRRLKGGLGNGAQAKNQVTSTNPQ